MREIKFRAWLPVGEWTEDGSTQKYEMVNADALAFEEYEPLSDHLRNCENLMQFTGLKDKNGKEIYEGDIVITDWETEGSYEYPDETDWLCFVGAVEWKPGSLCWGFKHNPVEWAFHPGTQLKVLKNLINEGCLYSSRYLLCGDMGECEHKYEVIGNIYENPELLKGDD